MTNRIDSKAEQAYRALMALCARREICTQMAIDRLNKFELSQIDTETVLNKLKAQGFIDDDRFISSFVRYKLEFDGWGPRKIEQKLLSYNFSKEQIDKEFDSNTRLIEQKRQELIARKERELDAQFDRIIESQREKTEKKIEKLLEEERELSDTKKLFALRRKIALQRYSLLAIEKRVALSQRKKLLSFLTSRGFE